MFIVDGRDEDDVLLTAEKIAEICENAGALNVLVAEKQERQDDILELRSMIYEALRPGTAELLDISLPRSEIAAHIGYIRGLETEYGVSLPTFGHAADGNIHTHIMKNKTEGGRILEELPHWKDLHIKNGTGISALDK